MHTRIGVGGRMDTLQCAVVLAKLERFEWEVEQRLKTGARYSERVADWQGTGGGAAPRPNQCFCTIYGFRREPRTGAGKAESAGCSDGGALSRASPSAACIPRKLPSAWGASYSRRKV